MRKWISLLLVICLTGSICGCSVRKNHKDKLKDLDFTVVDEAEIPQELADSIKEKEKDGFRLTYADAGYLYVAEGFGKQDTSGYSITVDQFYETENAIYIHTNLLGPKKDEQVSETATYPYIVIKTELIEKNVVFE